MLTQSQALQLNSALSSNIFRFVAYNLGKNISTESQKGD